MADHARGERLRQLRSKRGLSQEEVAHALGVTSKTYGTWEKGGGIRGQNARLIARYFKVKPSEIITPDIEPEPTYVPGETVLTAEDVERLKRIEEKMDEILKRLPPAEEEFSLDDEPTPPESPGRDDEASDATNSP